jgi:WD40 repeat protein
MNPFAEFQSSADCSSSILRKIKGTICAVVGDQTGGIAVYSSLQSSGPTITMTDPNATTVSALELLPSISAILSGNGRGGITMIDLETGKPCGSFSKHSTLVKALRVYQSSQQCFASGSLDTTIRLWDVRQRTEIGYFKGHSKQVNDINIAPDDSILATASDDGTVKVWNLESGKLQADFATDKSLPILTTVFHPREFQVTFGGAERLVSFYSTDSFKLQGYSKEMPGAVSALAFDEVGRSLWVAGSGFLRQLNLPEVANFDLIDAPWKKPPQLLSDGKDLYGLSLHSRSIKISKLGANPDRPHQPDPDRRQRQVASAMQIETPVPLASPDPDQEARELEELQKGHVQIMASMQNKSNALVPIVAAFFEQGNQRAAWVAIEKLTDDKVVTDLLNMFMNTGALKKVGIDFATLLLKKASIIFENKYKYCLKTSLKFTLEAIKHFSKDIVSIKGFSQLAQYDLERDERIKRYDAFLAEVDGLVKKRFFGKLLTQLQTEEIGGLAQAVVNDYQFIVNSVKK